MTKEQIEQLDDLLNKEMAFSIGYISGTLSLIKILAEKHNDTMLSKSINEAICVTDKLKKFSKNASKVLDNDHGDVKE